ncbi:MAG TPA: nuclear transport factor 2 family protein [Acidimicrobiales bacterium]|nr:nuclear transport factor 2 family protein [Acidimicrobiales bacterium]
MPTAEEMTRALSRYAESFGARDLDTLVGLFTEDAVQADPANVPANIGHHAIRAFFQNAFDASSASTWEATAVHVCGNHVGVDFHVGVTMEAGAMTIVGVEVFTFADDARIAAVSAYWGDADITFTPA